jgi:hypothetical protein
VWSTTTILYKARPDGTGLSRLCTVGTDMHPWAGNVAWTEDDLILFAAGDSGIRSLSSSGGDPATFIPTLETDSDFHGIHVLPDDRGFLFMPHIDLGFDSIDLLSNNGRKQLLRVEGQQLHSAGYTNGHILFSRRPDNVGVWAVPYDLAAEEVTGAPFMAVADARFPTVSLAGDLVYSPDSPVRWQIVRVDRRGDITAQVAEEVEGAQLLRLSPDGTEAVYAVQGPANEIWIVDLTSGSRQRFAFDEQLLGSPSWSPDGSSLVYTVGVDEGLHQQIRARDGGAPETLHVRGHNPLFTPDGRHLVLEIWDEQNNPGIGYIDLDDREAGAVAIVDTNFEESAPALSPDGTLIAYESLEPGRREVFVTTFPDGDRSWQISNEGGSQPCWSADGSEIIFRNPSFPQKMVVEVSRDPVRFSAPRLLFSIDGVAWLNATEDRGFWGLRRVETGEQNSFEVWLGWAESLDR